MADGATLAAFLAAATVIAVSPGPAMLYVIGRTVGGGTVPGIAAGAGPFLGGLVAAASAGLASLLIHAPTAFLALKVAGVVWLLWIAAGMLRGAVFPPRPTADPATPGAVARGPAGVIVEGAAVNILNPKVFVFAFAFLPHFVDPAATRPVWQQIAILGVVFNLLIAAVDLACVVAVRGASTALAARPALVRAGKGAAGLLLAGLSVHLAFATD